MTDATTPPLIRSATPADVPAIAGLVRELAVFEKLEHMVQTTPETLHPHLFGERPVAECLVAQAGAEGPVVAFALFFHNFSTFLCRPGLYLEDLYVQPAHRGSGVGKALLVRLAQIAVARGCGRFEWTVLDWNTNAQDFYRRMGATVMTEWYICRVTGEALQRLGAPGAAGADAAPAA